jgi:hypothetical protein
MAVTLTEFKDYVGTKDASDFPQSCLTAGLALVTKYVGTVTTVPTEISDQAVLMAASELFHRRNAPNGIAQFADFGGAAVRVGSDPMVAARQILLPYLGMAV